MGSNLNKITCASVNENKVVFNLKTLIFNKVTIETSKAFYLEIVLEFFENELQGFLYTDEFGSVGMINEEEYLAKAKDSPYYTRLMEIHGYIYGKKVSITAQQFEEYKKNSNEFQEKYNVKTSSAYGSGATFYYTTQGEIDNFKKCAEEEIVSIKLNSFQENDHLNICEVEIRVKNINLLAHLVPGTIWGSAIYPL